ncbi:MAG: hypothetical protein EON58_08275 [Alphaproteobacteria bacterium]|nr:MAG: hypothetical protein EON58_08275 [Alphaproteobacteria bacterium]
MFLAFGSYAVLCAPAILISEHFGLSDDPLQMTQPIAVLGCIASSALFLFSTRGRPLQGIRLAASIALLLASLWASFVVFVIMTLDFGAD